MINNVIFIKLILLLLDIVLKELISEKWIAKVMNDIVWNLG